jgi:hypothetical protein
MTEELRAGLIFVGLFTFGPCLLLAVYALAIRIMTGK